MKLLSLFLAVAPTAAYTSSASIAHPLARPFGVGITDKKTSIVPIRRHPSAPTEVVSPKDFPQEKKRKTYELGIGKHQPVFSQSVSPDTAYSTTSAASMEEVTQYWVEHTATREYPAPTALPAKAETKTKRVLPKVQPERRTQDSLNIRSNPLAESGNIVPIIQPTSQAKLDVNTVWVEMMLHDEQEKLGLAPSAL